MFRYDRLGRRGKFSPGTARHGVVWQATIKGGSFTTYKWKYGISGVSAQRAGEYFESLEKRDGEVKPKTIVKEAKSADSLLHPAFEWNDTEAAEKYREQQAKQIIRDIVVVQESVNENPIITRAIVNVSVENSPITENGKYCLVSTAMSNPETREIVLRRALKELMAFKEKYSEISELAGLFSEIDKIQKPA